MGGEIEARSFLGRGSIFTVILPFAPIADSPQRRQVLHRRAIALAPDQPTYRILIVEDKWESRQLLMRLLEPLGFEVREATNGREAIALWRSWNPNLIWMDMRMPVMDGYEATRQIKAHASGQDTAILALTASALEEEKTAILLTGCDDFVRKPFREETILEKMAEYLGVRYLYDAANEVEGERANANAEGYTLTAESLSVMPPEWIEQLHQASMLADEELVLPLIEQIPEEQASLAKALANLVYNFRCDQIMRLTQPASD